jgi:hypothetical protein
LGSQGPGTRYGSGPITSTWSLRPATGPASVRALVGETYGVNASGNGEAGT